MKRVKLGTTDLDISEICLGTMTWGQQNNEKEAHKQLDYAIKERGINFMDTAEMYPVPPEKHKQGRTETYIGNWLKTSGMRDKLIIASKVAVSDLLQTRDVSETPRYDAKSIKEAIEGSLKRLQTDYLDIYYVHWPERTTNFFGVRGYQHDNEERATSIQETLTALTELVKEGKIRHVAISNETPWGVSEYLRLAKEYNLAPIVAIQNQYSLTNRTFEIGLAEFSMRENIPLLAYSVLNMGVLTGKYLGGAKPEGARFTLFQRNRNTERYNPPRAQEVVKKYIQVAKDHGLDIAQMAIAFALSRDFVAAPIIGATSMEQLKTDIDAAEVKLSDEVLETIEKVHDLTPDLTH
jgi:aryl-alcohol dehydrogenase-like predicted oxidoreductase